MKSAHPAPAPDSSRRPGETGPGRAFGIFARTALLTWLVASGTLAIFIAAIVPAQRAEFRDHLRARARSVATSLQDVTAGAAISDDYGTIVDRCTRMLAEDSTITYLVLTRQDGFSLIHERTGWRSDTLRGAWMPTRREARGAILRTGTNGEPTYHFTCPFDYSGIEWGWIHVGLSLDSYNRSLRALYRRTAVAALLCLVLGLLVSLSYARRLTQPITRLRQAVQRLAGGDLSARAQVTSRDEVGELGATFDRMASSLHERDTMLQSLRVVAQRFLAAGHWQTVIGEVLETLGRAADASRVDLLEAVEEPGRGLVLARRHEWTADHSPRPGAGYGSPHLRLADPALEPWRRRLQAGEAMACRRTEVSDSERVQAFRDGVQSLVLAPVHVAGQWWGAIGVSECRRPREWSEPEITSLRAAAHTLGAAIERDRDRVALLAAKESAEAGSLAKSQFLANMSHEIRTPITGVMGMLHLLQRTGLDAAQQRYVGNAVSAAGTLLNVIGDILDFSKIEAGRLEIEATPFAIPDMLDDILRVFAETAEARQLELTCRLEGALPRQVVGDSGRIQQILLNLIGNALKFTEQGEIAIVCRLQAELPDTCLVRFSVRDTGCGIPDGQQARVFEAFSQADGSMSRRHGGTGLGLAISRQLCHLMGGEIGVESEPGRGSTFWFTVRLRRGAERGEVEAPLSSLKGLRVLVVDDCRTAREIVCSCVTAWQGLATATPDGLQGLELLRSARAQGEPFDVAVLDWRMPGLDGVTMARRIRSDPELGGTGLVLLTAFGGPPDEAADGVSPFSAWVPKPARMSELYDALVVAANRGVAPPARSRMTTVERAPVARPGQSGMVLLVEDNDINREVAVEMIRELGFECRSAANGREAVEAVQAGGVDLVLMDCQMPVMDGYEATAMIRQREKSGDGCSGPARLPIIALTAHVTNSDREVCLQHGMDDFLTKPLDPARLADTLARWMRSPAPASPSSVPPNPVEAAASSETAGAIEPAGLIASAGTVDPDPIDRADLLSRCMGRADLADRFVRRFRESGGAGVDEVAAAVARRDAGAVRATAHRLKGAAATVSAVALSRVAADLEVLGIEGRLEESDSALGRLRVEWQRILDWPDPAPRRVA